MTLMGNRRSKPLTTKDTKEHKEEWETHRGINSDRRGSGGLAAQFRERPGCIDKMLKAHGGSPFQSCGRSYNDDPIGGLETMTAFGNFFQDAI